MLYPIIITQDICNICLSNATNGTAIKEATFLLCFQLRHFNIWIWSHFPVYIKGKLLFEKQEK